MVITDFPDLRDTSRAGRALPIKAFLPEGTDALPVLVFSHGAGGSRDGNFAQAHHLASHGFAVLAIEHTGSNTPRLLEGGRYMVNLQAMTRDAAEVLGRPRDVSFALDRAAQWQADHPQLRTRLDLTRIAVAGHSFGAYTALSVCGARPVLDWLTPAVAPGSGLGPDLSDPRVRVCIALSPQGPGAPFFGETSYASIDRPVLAITGSRDEQQGAPPSNRRRYFELVPPGGQVFIWLNNADHNAFSDSSGSGRRGLASPSRADAQPLVRAAMLLFLDQHLRGNGSAEASLSTEGLRPLLRGVIDGLEVLRK